MVIVMVMDVNEVAFRLNDDGDHSGGMAGDDCCDGEDGNSTRGRFRMVSVISGNPEGECDSTEKETD